MRRLRRLLDWCCPDRALSLGVLTRGGLMDLYGPARLAPRSRPVITASGGVVIPFAFGLPHWEPWARWYPPTFVENLLPRFVAERGGIRVIPRCR